jgi:hypothetical protein
VHPWNPLGIVAAIYSRWSNRKDRRAGACANFRSAFLHELEGLYPQPSNWPKAYGIDPTLRRVFPVLQAAVAEFRPYVPDDQKEAFDIAWRDYRCSTKRDVDTQDYTHYMNIGTVSENASGGLTEIRRDGRANFKKTVDRLLEFAKDV